MAERARTADSVSGPAPSATTPAVVAIAVGAMTALDPSLYVPQELRQPSRRDTYEVDDAINIIEEGEHVSAEDFGLSSTEISMSAPIAMPVGMELNAMQPIDAFLTTRPSTDGLSSDLPARPQSHSQHSSDPRRAKQESNEELSPRKENNRSKSVTSHLTTEESNGSTESQGMASSLVLFPTRRGNKLLQLESHPLVQSVATDGRNVMCKCGKSVRLNPPWYIIKFEQHIVSRNCTFLRKKKSKRDQESQEKQTHDNMTSGTVDNPGRVSQNDPGTEESSAGESQHNECRSAVTVVQVNGGSNGAAQYGLEDADVLLELYSWSSQGQDTVNQPSDGTTTKESIVKTLNMLKTHPHFSRITPDGKFVECKCSELIILDAPWALREFHVHVDSKSKPQVSPRRRFSTGSSTKRPRLGDGAAQRVEQRLIVREARWKPVSKHSELPCPGLRGERVRVYINSTTKTTGGSRARRRIAEELFPHLTSNEKDKKIHPKLTAEEKQLLRDAVESEALWFIDHDANAVRSLDCRGSIAVNKCEDCCVACSELRLNASLRISVTVAMGHKRIPDDVVAAIEPNTHIPTKSKGSMAAFALLEQEFDMREEHARLLRDLFRADVEEGSVKNVWFDMADLGITGSFVAHPAFMGLIESMMVLKDKERRGVGLQNMVYSDHLDSFMKSMSDISPQACDFFQRHLGGRKQKYLYSAKRRKVDGKDPDNSPATTHENPHIDPDAQEAPSSSLTTSTETFSHLPFDLANSTTMQNLADMQDVDLSSFQAEHSLPISEDASAPEHEETEAFLTEENLDVVQEDIDDGSICEPTTVAPMANPIMPGYIPCRGLRDPKVQAYVVNAVQIIGGSRPKYVIAKELFPEVFGDSRKIKITEKLSEEERGIVADAIFSECLWRVDRVSNCVRSLRCFRRVDKKRGNGVCRACLDLKSIANFRSVLCRAKVPKKVENLKFVPSVYTESDPFMRKLSKNASLRTLYQTVKRAATEEKKSVTFWLRFAKMGLFGHFRSHVVFEGLIASMVEIKDRERRGVGKQNMLYAKTLDEFMAGLSTISLEAFELFSHHFCGRTTRSQKVKKRKALTQLYDSAIQQARVANSLAMASASSGATSISHTPSLPLDMGVSQPPSSASITTATSTTASVGETHPMVISEDLLGSTRPISTAEMEENQRFMDHMLDEVRLSHDDHEHDEHLDPQTYLDENGVLTTVL